MVGNYRFSADRAAELLTIMANDGRLRVLQLISDREWDVGSLAEAVNLSQSALSQHLKKMRDARIVRFRREAQTIYYSCADPSVGKVMDTLQQIFAEKKRPKAAA